MAKTAAENAQIELDKAVADVEKKKTALDKAKESVAAAEKNLEVRTTEHAEALEMADYLAGHPALRQQVVVTAAPDLDEADEPAPGAQTLTPPAALAVEPVDDLFANTAV